MERLIVKNFGPIKELDIEVRKFTVLIGEQASGKSTVAKLLAIFRDVEMLLEDDPREIPSLLTDYGLSDYLSKDSYMQFSSGLLVVSLEGGQWSLHHHVEGLKEFAARMSDVMDNTLRAVDQALRDIVIKRFPEIAKGLDPSDPGVLAEVKLQVGNVIQETKYIPAERVLASLISAAPFTLGELAVNGSLKGFLKQFELARQRIPTLEMESMDATYRFENGENRVYLKNGSFIRLSDAASGMQALVPLRLIVAHLTRQLASQFFIVEEPELNLFPSAQKEITEYLVGTIQASHPRGGLMICTHSPYVLTTFNNLLYAHRQSLKFPDHAPDIAKIVPAELQISADQFAAYYLSGGTAKSILDAETGLISAEDLDSISDEIEDEFHQLLEFNFERKP